MADRVAVALAAAVKRTVATHPGKELSEAGWNMACGLALREYWPDVTPPEAAKMLTEYIGEPFGRAGYDWTFKAAQTVATEYVADFGEATRP